MSVDPLTALANGQHTLKNVDYSCSARPLGIAAAAPYTKKLTQGTTHEGWKINHTVL